jgi:hypothetical protein
MGCASRSDGLTVKASPRKGTDAERIFAEILKNLL